MTINDFLGNNITKETFLGFLKNKKIPHSIIFEGNRGIGKKTFAKIIAQSLVCNAQTPVACENCNACYKASKDVHPDIIYPQKSGALNTYNVATVREIRKDAYILPNEADYKIYMFLDADNMNASAQNALLKIIEEPPKNVVFIFTCISSKCFLDTIKSRSQLFKLEPPTEDDALAFLKGKFPAFDMIDLKKYLRLASFNVGEAMTLLSGDGQNEEYFLAENILKALFVPNEAELLKVVAKIKNDKDTFKIMLNFLFKLLSEALSASVDSSYDACELSKNVAQKISIKKIMALLDFVNEISEDLKKNANFNLLLACMTSNMFSIVFGV